MSSNDRHSTRAQAVVCLLLMIGFLFAVPAQATDREALITSCPIKNFGKIDDNIYRGGQPKKDEYRVLATIGIKTVIDLRDDAKDYAKAAAEDAGLRYINVPMDDKSLPSDEQTDRIMSMVNKTEDGPFYIHCAGGRHRTGVAVAVYRFHKYNWDYDQAYREMKDYDFYTRWGHGPMKDYVQSYYKNYRRKQDQAAAQ